MPETVQFDESAECLCGLKGCYIIDGEAVCPTCHAADAMWERENASEAQDERSRAA